MEPDVTLVSDASCFIDAVVQAVSHDSKADRARRRRLAARNSWEAKTDRLLGLAERELEAGEAEA